jgi:single-strand DNA-binding protein
MQTNKWEDKEGNTRYTTEVIVNVINYLADYDVPDQGNDGGGGEKAKSRPEAPPIPSDDDIPF